MTVLLRRIIQHGLKQGTMVTNNKAMLFMLSVAGVEKHNHCFCCTSVVQHIFSLAYLGSRSSIIAAKAFLKAELQRFTTFLNEL